MPRPIAAIATARQAVDSGSTDAIARWASALPLKSSSVRSSASARKPSTKTGTACVKRGTRTRALAVLRRCHHAAPGTTTIMNALRRSFVTAAVSSTVGSP